MRLKALLALLVATAIWGVAGSVIKLTLESVPPFTFLAFRFLIAAFAITPFLAASRGFRNLKREELIPIIGLALLGQSLCLGLTFLGYAKTTVLEAAVIGTSGPLLQNWAGAFFLKEEITKKEKIGTALALMGAFVAIFVEPILSGGHNIKVSNIWGNLLIFSAQLVWIAYIILEKRRLSGGREKKSYQFEGMALSFIVGFVTFAPLAVFEMLKTRSGINLQILLHTNAIAGILFMGILSSVVAYVCHDYGLSKVESSETGIYGYLAFLFAIPAAYFLLGETPTVFLTLGAILIAAGFYVSERKQISS